MGEASRQMLRDRFKGWTVILSSAVGTTHNFPIPSGTETASCDECGAAVWVMPPAQDFIKASGLRPVYYCDRCLTPPEPGVN